MPSSSLTLVEILQVLNAPLEELTAWALLHNAARSIQDAHEALQRSPDSSLSGVGPHLIIHHETLFIQRRGKLQFSSGIQTSVDARFSAPELQQKEQEITGGKQLAQAQVFSLSVVVSTALEYEEKREVSKPLNSLLAQMESKNADKRPTFTTIIKVATEHIETLSTNSSADDELDKLFSMVYGDQDQLETSFGDSDSVADDLTLAAELAAVEQRRRNSIGSTDLHSSVNESHSEDCMSLTSKGSVGVHGSMDSLHRQGSTRSNSSAAGGLYPSTLRTGDNGRKFQKIAPNARWSSYERLRLQQRESEVLTNKTSTELSHSMFYTPVRHRRAGTPPAGAGLPPRPPSVKIDDHGSDMHTRDGNVDQSTETQKLDQLLVEIDNSPLHSESAPDLIAAGIEPFLPPASSTPNILATTGYSDRKLPSLPPNPLLVNVHPEARTTSQMTNGWQQEKEDEADFPIPSPPPSSPPQLPSQEDNSTEVTFEYSSMPVPEKNTAVSLSGEFLFTDHTPEKSVTQEQDDSDSLPPTPPLPSSQLPTENDQETEGSHTGGTITTSMALNEALEVLDNEHEQNGIPKDSPYETLSWETSSERHAKDDEEVDGYSVPRFLTSEIIKTSSSQSPADKVPEKAKPLADNPPEEDKVYAVVKKVKKKEVTPSDIVLRHIQPPSLRSSSVEDVSKDTAVVTKPYRASMPPDLLLEHSPSLQTDVNVVPPISLSPEPGESLLLPSSDYSINKLQTVFGDEFMQLSGGPRKSSSDIQLSLDAPKKKRVVHVHLLNDTVLTLYVNPMCMCRDFFHHVACLLDVQEWISFGLSVFQDDGKPYVKTLSSSSEEVFLEPDRQIYKYAPEQWRKMPPPEPGDRNPRHQSPPFTVNFRVMFYIRRLAHLGIQQTRHLYYLQLRQDLRRGKIECSWNEQLKLTALAMQCEYGDFSNIATPQQYFKARHYLPQLAVREKNEQAVTDQLTELHAEHIGMTNEQAEERFLQEAMSLKNYGKIVYNVTRQETKAPAQMAFTVNGISIYDIQHNRKRCVVECIWRSISNIAFDHRKITLMVEGRDPVIILAPSFRRAAYLLRFVKLCHKFQIYTRTHAQQPPQPLPSLSNQVQSSSVKLVPAVEDKLCPEYEGEMMTIKMLKREGQGVGLRISDNIASTGVTYAEVETLVEGGVAGRYLKTGDLLLKLNEKTLCGLAHHEVGEMFRTSPPLLKVVVLRRELNKNAVPNATKQSEKKLDQDSTDKEVKTSTRHFKAPPAPPVRHHDSNLTITDSPETSEAEQHSRADSSEIHHDDGEESLSNDTAEQVKLVSEASTEAASADNNNQKLKSISLEDNTSDATDGAETSSQTESSPRDFTQFTSTTTLESDSLDEIDVQPVPISIGDTRTLRIHRKEGSFGFAIKGSTKNRYRPVRVSTITEGGAAEEKELCIGDRIISVNGQAIEGRGYKEAFHLLQTSGEVVTILIAKGQPGTDKISVTLNKNDGALGFRYSQQEDYTVVTAVTRNSQAAKAGLKEGDLILEINGQSLVGVSQREVYALLACEQSAINLLVEKTIKPLESIPEQLDTRPEDYQSGSYVTVTLRKEKRQLGFRIKKNPVNIIENCGLFVTSIDRDPALCDGRILVGDELVKINGKSLIGLSHENALQLLKGEPEECMFVIRRQTAHPQVSTNVADGGMYDVVSPPSLSQSAPPDTPTEDTPTISTLVAP